MALNPSGAISLGGPTAGQSIAVELGLGATTQISLNDTVVRTLGGIASGPIAMSNFYAKSNITGTQLAIFAYGQTGPTTRVNTRNLVSNTGVFGATTTGIGTVRSTGGAASYGTDKAIFAFGLSTPTPATGCINTRNLVSNTGVVSADSPGVGTARQALGSASYGTDKAIFAFGNQTTTLLSITNLVSNTGIVAADTPGAAGVTAKNGIPGASYGTDKAIFAFGAASGPVTTNTRNLVSNTGVVSATAPGVGTARSQLAAAGYGTDKAIFGYGISLPAGTRLLFTNLVSNTGVVATDVAVVGNGRQGPGAANYGANKALFFGGLVAPAYLTTTNLVSNLGICAGDTPTTGVTGKGGMPGAGYSLT